MSIWIKRWRHALGIFVFLIPICIGAQTYQTMSMSTENGLPSNQVNCIATDPLGFLWLGTNAGLVRWDQEMTTYTTNNGLLGNEITALTTDINNRLWIGTKKDGLCFIFNNVITTAPSKNELVSKNITSLHYSAKNQLLMIGTSAGLSVYDGTMYKNHNGFTASWQITSFIENDSSVWFCTAKQGMYYYHFKEKKVHPLSRSLPIYEASAFACFRDSNGDIIISTANHGFKVESQRGVKAFPIDIQVTQIQKDKWGSIWIAGNTTLDQQPKLYLFKNENLIDFTPRLQLPDKPITCIFADKNEGALITALQNTGLIICPSTTFQEFEPNAVQNNHIQDIAEDREQNIWLASNCFLKITIDNDDTKGDLGLIVQVPNQNKLEPSIKIQHLERSYSDIVYLSGGTLYKLNNKGNKPFKLIDSTDDPIELFAIYKTLLITKTRSSLIFYNNQSLKKISSIPFQEKVISMHTGSKSTWMLTTDGHLYKVDNSTLKITPVNADNGLLPSNIICIESDIRQNLLCADNYGNVYLLTENANQLLEVTEKWSLKTHFPGNTIQWLLCDSKNALWVGTDKGLSKVQLNSVNQKKHNIIQNWGKGEGYYCPSAIKAIEASNGLIWVLSDNKVTRFSPNDINAIERKPQLHLTHVKSSKTLHSGMSQRYISRIIDENATISFSNDENSIMFWFDITNALNKERVLYQYRLLPGNVEWSAPAHQPFVFISDLRPGNYTLSVQANFEHAAQNITINEYNFSIRSPWYLSLYAWIVYGIIIFLIAGIIIELKIKQIRSQEEIKSQTSERMALLKMEALQAQMNPHFIFNALNSLQYSILENNTETALEFIGEFSKLIRSTLDNASQHFITLQCEIDYIENYMKVEQMRYINAFYYSLTIADDIDPNQLYVPPMLLQPHIENAIKYAFTTSIGYIIISFAKIQDKLICMVEDNGIGRQQSMKRQRSHLSRSHNISKERFEMLNQFYKQKNEFKFEIEDLVDDDNNSTGTRVTLIYPLIDADQVKIAEAGIQSTNNYER